MPCLACLLEELLFGNSLSRNSSMVCAGDEEGLIATHPFIPDECILNGDGEGVADVEVAGDVGRGEADGKLFGVGGLVVGVEELTA